MWRRAQVLAICVLASASLLSCSKTKRTELVLVDSDRNRNIEYTVRLPGADGASPLVIISHGTRGHYSDHRWLADALVESGFAVAALNHPHDTRRDQSPAGMIRVWDRPVDVSFLLTSLLNDPRWSESIDSERVGAAGYSSGGHTAISLAGGIFDPELMGEYCASDRKGPECDLAETADLVDIDFTDAGNSYRDQRIKVVFAMAPALGPGMTEEGLAQIDIPVGIVTAKDDELITPAHHAEFYSRHIPDADLRFVPNGGHFVFVTACTVMPTIVYFFIAEIDMCGREIDVDRESVQAGVAGLAVEFFGNNLAAPK